MSNNKNLFKEAIADAKAVREAALLNAKNALEEALTPSIQNMLAEKLNEMGDEYEKNEGFNSDLEEEFDLAEILAELEEEEHSDMKTEAKKAKKDEEEEEEEETEEEETEETEEEEAEEETEEGEKEVSEMSVEELKALIKDIVSQELEAEEAETPGDENMEMSNDMNAPLDMGDLSAEDSEEVDLEELLAELDSMGDGYDDMKEYAETSAEDMLMQICNDHPEHKACAGMVTAKMEAKKYMKIKAKAVPESKDKEEMKEAISVINVLRKELNETNLLNAKLLYVNKIFKSKNLSESQKLSVISAFDKAGTPKEAKMVYETLSNNLNSATKKAPIRESLGFASKASGMAPKKQIVESNDVISRMQKLANIIK